MHHSFIHNDIMNSSSVYVCNGFLQGMVYRLFISSLMVGIMKVSIIGGIIGIMIVSFIGDIIRKSC